MKYKIKGKSGTLYLDSQAVRYLLYSNNVRDAVNKVGAEITSRAGTGYELNVYSGHDRARGVIAPATPDAYKDNMQNNTLLKAVGK